MFLPASEGKLTIGGLCASPLISGVMAIHCIATSANAADIFKQALVLALTRVFVMEILLADFGIPSRNAQNLDALASCAKFLFFAAQGMARKRVVGNSPGFAQRRFSESL